METNEIMTNEEVAEAVGAAAEQIVTKDSGSRLRAAAVGGLVVLVGGLTVQYIILPAVAKVKAKKRELNTSDDELTTISSDATYDSDEEV